MSGEASNNVNTWPCRPYRTPLVTPSLLPLPPSPQGWYIGKKEGKLGAVNVHTQRISEWESYDQAAATLGSPGAGHHAAPGPPYLEATQDMLEYSEQEKYVYR